MINQFKDEHEFLSNFFPCLITMGGSDYPTVEHAYQAAKTRDPDIRAQIATKRTAGQAKMAGGRRGIIRDFDREVWEGGKNLQVMETLVRQKFTKHADLRKQLLDTSGQELIEGNTWNDTFWGVCQGRGGNHLGKILMKIRAELRQD